MKVGFVVDDSLDSTDGVQQYVLNLGKWMKRKGIDVHYLCGSSKRADLSGVHSLAKKIPVRFNNNRLTIPLPSSPRAIRQLLVKENFDVLHVQMPYSPMLAARIVQLSPPHTAVVGTFHIAPYSRFHQAAASVLGYVLRPNLRLFDAVFSVSSAAQETAKKTFKIDSMVLPNVVDYSAFRQTNVKPSSQDNIVFLGRLVDRKGCLELLRGYDLLLRKLGTNTPTLVIAGDGPDRDKIETFIKKKSLTNKVKMLGRISEEAKGKILSSAKIAVFPSKGGESFGIVLIEAMAAGSGVVLGGNNPGYSEVLSSPNYIFNPKKPHEVAEVLEKYLHKDLRDDHRIQNEIMKKYDIDVVAPKIMAKYKTIIAKKTDATHNKN
ncbi:MAG TPA: glycosyltransferase family 4 protein [Candidatus Saccharibacteria bacterium]|nr:glycosyltransferase family 4 protein [Candidatus Saccharibacteria bacterium]